jgi:hypothetical protein
LHAELLKNGYHNMTIYLYTIISSSSSSSIPLLLHTEHRALTVPRHPRLLFQFLVSIRYLVGILGRGDQSSAKPLTTKDNTTQKDANIHALSRI